MNFVFCDIRKNDNGCSISAQYSKFFSLKNLMRFKVVFFHICKRNPVSVCAVLILSKFLSSSRNCLSNCFTAKLWQNSCFLPRLSDKIRVFYRDLLTRSAFLSRDSSTKFALFYHNRLMKFSFSFRNLLWKFVFFPRSFDEIRIFIAILWRNLLSFATDWKNGYFYGIIFRNAWCFARPIGKILAIFPWQI